MGERLAFVGTLASIVALLVALVVAFVHDVIMMGALVGAIFAILALILAGTYIKKMINVKISEAIDKRVLDIIEQQAASVSEPRTYVTYEARKEAVEQLIADLEQDLRDRPHDKVRLYTDVEVVMPQLLGLAVAITDNPAHGLSANFMTYSPDEKSLAMTHAAGVYTRYRLHEPVPKIF
jgi:hypothetical protein